MKVYAGIGSRNCPVEAQRKITDTAVRLAAAGWVLSSGGAKGADQAFERGATKKAIFRRDGKIPPRAYEIAEAHHPAWDRCKFWVKALLARNAQIILGPNLDSPVEFVLFWSEHDDPLKTGGTAHSFADRLIAQRSLFPDRDSDGGFTAPVRQERHPMTYSELILLAAWIVHATGALLLSCGSLKGLSKWI